MSNRPIYEILCDRYPEPDERSRVICDVTTFDTFQPDPEDETSYWLKLWWFDTAGWPKKLRAVACCGRTGHAGKCVPIDNETAERIRVAFERRYNAKDQRFREERILRAEQWDTLPL